MRTGARRSIAVAITALALALPVAADDYDPHRAAHPMRIVAYVLHPVGVVLDLLLFRPAHWLGSHEPIASLVGHERYRD